VHDGTGYDGMFVDDVDEGRLGAKGKTN